MFGDTVSFALAGIGSLTLNKVNQDNYTAEYLCKQSTFEVRCRVRHTKVKATASQKEMDRHNVELVLKTYATAEVEEHDQKVYVVIENRPWYNGAYILADALCDWLIASTDANLIKLHGWES